MAEYNVAAAKDGLSRLIDKAMRGEEVVITRRGKPVVELRVVVRPEARSSEAMREWLRKRRDARPRIDIDSTKLIREMRDEGL